MIIAIYMSIIDIGWSFVMALISIPFLSLGVLRWNEYRFYYGYKKMRK